MPGPPRSPRLLASLSLPALALRSLAAGAHPQAPAGAGVGAREGTRGGAKTGGRGGGQVEAGGDFKENGLFPRVNVFFGNDQTHRPCE